MKTYVVGTQFCLNIEAIPMSTHNIIFMETYEKITKLSTHLVVKKKIKKRKYLIYSFVHFLYKNIGFPTAGFDYDKNMDTRVKLFKESLS